MKMTNPASPHAGAEVRLSVRVGPLHGSASRSRVVVASGAFDPAHGSFTG